MNIKLQLKQKYKGVESMKNVIIAIMVTLALAFSVAVSFGKDKTLDNKVFCSYFSAAEYEIYRIIVNENEFYPTKKITLSDELIAKIKKIPCVEDNPRMFENDVLISIIFGNSKSIWEQAGSLYLIQPHTQDLKDERYIRCMDLLAGT